MINTCEAYDFKRKRWQMLHQRIREDRSNHCMFVHNNRLHIVGGWDPNDTTLSSMEVLDLNQLNRPSYSQEQAWKPHPSSLVVARSNFSVAKCNGKVYAVGGNLAAVESPIDSIEIFDPATEKWSLLDTKIPVHRLNAAVAAYKNLLLYVGGNFPGNDKDGRCRLVDVSTQPHRVRAPATKPGPKCAHECARGL